MSIWSRLDIVSEMLDYAGLPTDHPVMDFGVKSCFDAEALEQVEACCAEWFGEIDALFPDPVRSLGKEVIRDAFCLGKIMGVYEPAWYLFSRDLNVAERDTKQYRVWLGRNFYKIALLPITPTPDFWEHLAHKAFLGGKRFGCAERFSK